MTDEDVSNDMSYGSFPNVLNDQDDANEENNGSSQRNKLASSTPHPTKRALSFGANEEKESKKLRSSPDPTIKQNIRLNNRLNRSLASADRKRFNSQHVLKIRKMKFVEKRLALVKVKNAKRVSTCVKAAISNGFIKILGSAGHDLRREIISGPLQCGHNCTATLADVLYQPDFVGVDPNTLSRLATVFCSFYSNGSCPEGWAFVTGMCKGKPRFDWTGESVNHCKKCDSVFGECADDYKSTHCPKCGDHYSTACCSNCFPEKEVSDSDNSQNSGSTVEL